MSQDNGAKRPSFIAYHVRQGENTKAYFNRIGAAFMHKDGEGQDILLDAVPIDGRITLRSPQERSESNENEEDQPRRNVRRERGPAPR